MTAAAYVQVASGFDEWQQDSDRQNSVPVAVKVVFWILLVIAVVLYVAGWVLGVIKGKRLSRSSSEDTIRDQYMMNDGTKYSNRFSSTS